MSIKSIKYIGAQESKPRVGNISYGTLVIGLPGHPDVLYMKVKTRAPGMGLTINKSRNHSVLVNMKCGTFREVRGDTRVRIVSAEMCLTIVKADEVAKYIKDPCYLKSDF